MMGCSLKNHTFLIMKKILNILSIAVVLSIYSCKSESPNPVKSVDDDPVDEPLVEYLSWTGEGKSEIVINGADFLKVYFDNKKSDSTMLIEMDLIKGVPFDFVVLSYSFDSTFGYTLHEGDYTPDVFSGNVETGRVKTFRLATLGTFSGNMFLELI